MSQPQPIARTPTSTVFQVVRRDGATAVLKCLTQVGHDDERLGAKLLEWYGGDGAVQLIAAADTAHLIELADGGSLVDLVRDGRDDEAAGIVCDVVRRLHRSRPRPQPTLTALRQRFRSLLVRTPDSRVFHDAALEAEALLDDAASAIPLHGDLHHGNILSSDQHGWLAIDPKGLLGEPAYDLANLFLNPVGLVEVVSDPTRIDRLADCFSRELGYERRRLLRFAYVHAALSACWTLAEGGDPAEQLRVAALIAQRW